jgi:beta-galactosidase
LTAFNAFIFGWVAKENYNDILRPYYDALYKMNVGVDFIDPSVNFALGMSGFGKYKMIIVPALYAASDDLLKKLNQFVKDGGHVVYTFKSGFSDENVKVRSTVQPGIINEVCGISYSQFTIPNNVSLKSDPYKVGAENNKVHTWMELITPMVHPDASGTTNVLAYYNHPQWGKYAAITQNQFGKGSATYIGCMTSPVLTEKILEQTLKNADVWGIDQIINFPLITKSGINQLGKKVHYYFNYSANPSTFPYAHKSGKELLSNTAVSQNSGVALEAWGVKIIEEN